MSKNLLRSSSFCRANCHATQFPKWRSQFEWGSGRDHFSNPSPCDRRARTTLPSRSKFALTITEVGDRYPLLWGCWIRACRFVQQVTPFSHLLIPLRSSASKQTAPTVVRRQEKTVFETPVTSGPTPSSGAKEGIQLLLRGWLSGNFRMNRGIRCLFGDIFAWFAAVLRNYPDMSNPFRVEWIADCFPCRTASPVIKPVLKP